MAPSMQPLVLLSLAASAAAFTTTPFTHSAQRSVALNGGASGFATSLEGKQETVEKVKSLMESSEMVFTVPASALTVKEVESLRRSVPESTTVRVVKNKLFARAVEGTEFEDAASGLLKGANMWFFIEEDIGGSIKAFNKFTKENGKKETHGILGGMLEGAYYDASQVEAIGNLPSKQELIARIAGGINAVPTKLARVVKAPNSKLARAIKLATVDENPESS